MIEEYHFGSIIIDGKTYNHDLEVRWTGEILDWWRKESHLIDVGDIKRALEQNPEVIVIGTGESGMARVTEALQEEIEKRGIKLIIDITREAVRTFNIINEESEDYNPPTTSSHSPKGERAPEEGKETKVIGLFHLTC